MRNKPLLIVTVYLDDNWGEQQISHCHRFHPEVLNMLLQVLWEYLRVFRLLAVGLCIVIILHNDKWPILSLGF